MKMELPSHFTKTTNGGKKGWLDFVILPIKLELFRFLGMVENYKFTENYEIQRIGG